MNAGSETPLRVLLLGPLREQCGRDCTIIAFPVAGNQEIFWAALQTEFPGLKSGRVRLARDGEFLDAAAPLRPGDEVALIPPVSGG